jgi:hypothetical protein
MKKPEVENLLTLSLQWLSKFKVPAGLICDFLQFRGKKDSTGEKGSQQAADDSSNSRKSSDSIKTDIEGNFTTYCDECFFSHFDIKKSP